MKWIGQHIWSLLSRFRSKVYLEDVDNAGSDTDAFLVKKSDGEVALRTGAEVLSDIGGGSGDVSFDGSTANGVLTYKDADEATVESSLTYDGTELKLQSSTADYPQIQLLNTTDDDQAAILVFNKLRADDGVATGQNVGEIKFEGQDSAQNTQRYAIITGKIDVGTSDHESGQLVLGVASHNGTIQSGLTLTGGSATLDNNGLLQVAAQSNITSLGTLTGLTVDDIRIDAKTITITGDTSDTCTITTGAAGATTITTTDAAGAAGHFEVAADGDITLDAAGTIKLEGPTRSTGQIHMTHHNFSDDIDTTKHYVGLARGDSENTATTQIHTPLVFPTAAKLLKIYLRANQNLSAKEITFTLETQATGVGFGTGPTIIGTKALSGPTNSSIVAYDMTADHIDSGDNIVDAGDAAYLGIQSSASTSTTKFYITCIWEIDFSSI
jgi:hypothetical protein